MLVDDELATIVADDDVDDDEDNDASLSSLSGAAAVLKRNTYGRLEPYRRGVLRASFTCFNLIIAN